MTYKISLLLLILVAAGSDGSLIESEWLVRHLLHKYNPALIPQEAMDGVTQNVTVKFVVMLHDVLGLDTDSGRLHAQLHVQMSWYDYQVTWDPTHYRGQMYLQFPANMLWLPDFTILNGMQVPPNKDTNVKVLSNGIVFWTTPIDVSLTCNYHFRDNLWSCPLHFGSWSYTAQDLDLMAVDRELRIVERLKYDWMMVTKTAKRREKYRKHTLCCPDEMNISWEYDLIIQKRTRKRGASLG